MTTVLCYHNHDQLRIFSPPYKETCYPLAGILPTSVRQHFVSIDLPLLDIWYKLNYTIRSLLCLTSFTWNSVFKVHPCCSMYQYSMLVNCPKIISIMWVYHCLFIPQLIDIWVVPTFWLLWIMLLWTYVYKYLCELMFSFLLGTYLGAELLAQIVMLCLTFYKTAQLFT